MKKRLYRDDPLSPHERDEHESDLISFSDRELDRLPPLTGGKRVLYAGGTSPLWIEGLAERLGPTGSLTVLDLDEEGLAAARAFFAPGDLPLEPTCAVGDVFDLPFERGSFDLVYSSGLLHELDVRGGKNGVLDALWEMHKTLVPGGAVHASDFVSGAPSAQLQEEAIEAEIKRLASGEELFGVRDGKYIRDLVDDVFPLSGVWVHPPFYVRHLDKLFLAQPEPEGLESLDLEDRDRLRGRWQDLRERVKAGGYTRPATLELVIRSG